MHFRIPRWPTWVISLVISVAVLVGLPGSAQAVDGRVPDGRSATPIGELTAYYWHGLDRDPDGLSRDNFMRQINADCRWGIIKAGFTILASGEARNRWHNNARDEAGMLYASLLNRRPSPTGLASYTSYIRNRGLSWTIGHMMSSRAYRDRLKAIGAMDHSGYRRCG